MKHTSAILVPTFSSWWFFLVTAVVTVICLSGDKEVSLIFYQNIQIYTQNIPFWMVLNTQTWYRVQTLRHQNRAGSHANKNHGSHNNKDDDDERIWPCYGSSYSHSCQSMIRYDTAVIVWYCFAWIILTKWFLLCVQGKWLWWWFSTILKARVKGMLYAATSMPTRYSQISTVSVVWYYMNECQGKEASLCKSFVSIRHCSVNWCRHSFSHTIACYVPFFTHNCPILTRDDRYDILWYDTFWIKLTECLFPSCTVKMTVAPFVQRFRMRMERILSALSWKTSNTH